MTFLELVKKRASVRGYTEQAVEEEKLAYILECARQAPSAVNWQPWKFIVIVDQKLREEINTVYKGDWIKSAPIILVICGDHNQSWKRADGTDYCYIDIAIATDHITLAAAEQGLGTCWVCNFDAKLCSEILQLPANIEPIVLLPIGYPSSGLDLSRHGKRKEMNEILYMGR